MDLAIPADGYRAVIFDCDGTLVDSMPLHYEAWIWALERNGFLAHLRERRAGLL